MSISLSYKEESIGQIKSNENTLNSLQRKPSNVSTKNKFKMHLDCPTPKNKGKLNKSISKFSRRKSQLNMNKSKDNILNDYLHSHKFDIQRKNSKRITVKTQKNNINLNMNKSLLNFNNNNNHNDWMSMIYYPEDKINQKKNKNNFLNIKNEEKTNLKLIENSIMFKLNSLRNNYQLESSKNVDSFDDYFDNNIFKFNNEKRNSIQSMTKNLKKPINRNIKSLDCKSMRKNLFINLKRNSGGQINLKKSKRRNSINSNLNSNTTNSNHHSNFANNRNTPKKYKSEFLNNSFDKKHSFEQIDSKMNAFKTSKKNFKKDSKSTKSLNNNLEYKDRLRFLTRIKPLYDSFDDDETDKDEGNSILPTNYIIFFFDLFLFLSSIYCLFYIPLRTARSDCFCNNEHILNIILLYITDILFIGDFCLGFFRAYYNFEFKMIKNSKRIVFHYLKTDFCFDFLEAIPLFTFSSLLCNKKKEVNYCFRYNMAGSLIVLKMLTNIKIFKIFKVRNKRKNMAFNYLFNLFSENYSFEKLIDNCFSFTFCFLAFHFFVCLNIYLSKQTYPNWLITNQSQDEPLIVNYILSSYSLIETLTTVGYGDVVCQSNIERIFQIFFLGVGVIAYSYLISSFGNLFKNESQSSINYSNNMKILEEIRVEYPKMPYKLYNKIYNYIESKNLAEKKSDANVLTNSLPFNLKNALLLIMYRTDIKNFKIFKNCENSNFIIEILSNFIPSTSKKSEFLVYEGEMIEDIIIIKDGRLSLEAAINMEDPESSIRNYFNVNFQGITTEKEMKKFKESFNENTSQFIQNKITSDFDNVKSVLNIAVKKQANNLLNEVYDDISILDKTRNDNKNDIQQEKIIHNPTTDHLKHEPIKNEKGNFKYIKILDIRKNENYGGLYIFMRRPSPLSLKVRSKFAELYLLPKKEVFTIAKNYRNIWSKIHKKDFHNMLSIKHQTFNILNKYIEINGIGKISPNDVSRYVYAWEEVERKNKQLKNSKEIKENTNINEDSNNKSDTKFLYFKKNSSQICPSPINNKKNNNLYNHRFDLFSNKSLDKSASQSNNEHQHLPTENDFSHLLNIMVNGKQPNNNNNNNTNNQTNHEISNNNNNNINNNSKEEKEKGKDSSRSFASNFFDNKQNTKNSNDGNTVILPKSSEMLLPTLNNIFTDKKAEKIKEEMKKTRKKENRKKLFSLGKKTAKIIRNQNYSMFLLEKSTNQCIDIKNNNQFYLPDKSLEQNNEKVIDGLNTYLTFCQDNLFLDKISEINSSSENNSIHAFNKKDLLQESTISFSFEPIYQNINIHTKMKYSEDKNLQQKTLNYLTKIIENNDKSSSMKSFSYTSEFSPSSSFSNELSNKEKKVSFTYSKNKRNLNSSVSDFMMNTQKYDELLFETSPKRSKHKSVMSKPNNPNSLHFYSSLNSKGINSDINDKNSGYNSVKPKKTKFDDNKNKNKKSSVFKQEAKFTFKIDTINNERKSAQELKMNSKFKSSNNERNDGNDFLINNKLQSGSIATHLVSEVLHKNTNYLNIKDARQSQDIVSDKAINNIKTVKIPKYGNKLDLNIGQRGSNISDNNNINKKLTSKAKYAKKITKRKSKQSKNKNNQQSHKFKSEQKLIEIEGKRNIGGVRNSYFAEEKKGEDCLLI